VRALFAESGSRLLVCVGPAEREAFEALLAGRQGLPWARLGTLTAEPRLRVRQGGDTVVDRSIAELRARFKETLDEL